MSAHVAFPSGFDLLGNNLVYNESFQVCAGTKCIKSLLIRVLMAST